MKIIVHKRAYTSGINWWDSLRCNINNYKYLPRSNSWKNVTCKNCLRLKGKRRKVSNEQV